MPEADEPDRLDVGPPLRGSFTRLGVFDMASLVAVFAAISIRFELPSNLLDVPEQRAGFVLLAGFLISFLFIPTSARLMRSPRVPWWPGSV